MAKAKVLPLFICFYTVIVFAPAATRLVCPFHYCDNHPCPEILANCTGPDHEIGRGGFCGCCKYCVTLLGK